MSGAPENRRGRAGSTRSGGAAPNEPDDSVGAASHSPANPEPVSLLLSQKPSPPPVSETLACSGPAQRVFSANKDSPRVYLVAQSSYVSNTEWLPLPKQQKHEGLFRNKDAT